MRSFHSLGAMIVQDRSEAILISMIAEREIAKEDPRQNEALSSTSALEANALQFETKALQFEMKAVFSSTEAIKAQVEQFKEALEEKAVLSAQKANLYRGSTKKEERGDGGPIPSGGVVGAAADASGLGTQYVEGVGGEDEYAAREDVGGEDDTQSKEELGGDSGKQFGEAAKTMAMEDRLAQVFHVLSLRASLLAELATKRARSPAAEETAEKFGTQNLVKTLIGCVSCKHNNIMVRPGLVCSQGEDFCGGRLVPESSEGHSVSYIMSILWMQDLINKNVLSGKSRISNSNNIMELRRTEHIMIVVLCFIFYALF